jgi:Flp pilus assembly protein TadB
MESQGDRHQELEQRERILREREIELRLREMDSEVQTPNVSFHQTLKHQPEKSEKLWVKKVIFGAKLFAIGVAALVAVKVASALAGVVIVALLGWMSYKLFFEFPKNKP